MHYAAAAGRDDVLAFLAAKRGRCRARSREGLTALHIAARSRSVPCATLLLAVGASVDDTDAAGETPLFNAVKNGDRSMMSLLLDNGADVDARNAAGSSIMHLAAHHHCALLLSALISRSPDMRTVDSAGNTALHIAAASANLPFITECTHRIAFEQREQKNIMGLTPQDIIERGSCDLMRNASQEWEDRHRGMHGSHAPL
ncbi:ankyrin repeat-containing domain protein [Tribonema minus]|uniref:Ankyrin repeat-containing domain protein n=2 Tax=Tribonema minus TaxID=303371 RepID=A0A835Z4G1_9STRA|nr:ankyrin repeat-containing domain protein [Tribonema minus]KAG5182929.1 ankyrin repeat-containing domain protein [Tribonema minus]